MYVGIYTGQKVETSEPWTMTVYSDHPLWEKIKDDPLKVMKYRTAIAELMDLAGVRLQHIQVGSVEVDDIVVFKEQKLKSEVVPEDQPWPKLRSVKS